MEHLKALLNSPVLITNKRGTRYIGMLVGFNQKEGKFCLNRLGIVNQEGGITTPKGGAVRWFKAASFDVRETRSPVHTHLWLGPGAGFSATTPD